jgi:MFS family permease
MVAMGWVVLVVAAGWIIGSLYFHWVSGATLKLERRSVLQSIFQTLVLSFFWLTLLSALGFPVVTMFVFVSMLSPILGQGLFFLLSMFSLWVILPVFFSPHGIYAFQQNALLSVLSSLRMIRYTLPTSGLFLLGAFILGQGTGYLWRIPVEASWWVLVGIAGHAFVTTAILASSFIYYRDANVWLRAVLEKLSVQPTSAKI